jgi:predicted ATPase
MPLAVIGFFAEGYRSLQRISLPVDKLNVFAGANGVGKTNLYRAFELLQAAATGELSKQLAAEGGMESALFAGRQSTKKPVRITLRVRFQDNSADDNEYEYEISIGLVPQKDGATLGAAFIFEPQVKEERLVHHRHKRTYPLLERQNSTLTVVGSDGVKTSLGVDLLASETALANLQDPDRYPELHNVREALRSWRFYHGFRTDSESSLRRDCLAVTSPTLESDGANLASVFATLTHIRGDTADLDSVIDDAFPGAVLEIPPPRRTASFGMRFSDFPLRIFDAVELSDGTLRYIALVGALLAYRLPPFIALNEPETSLHPDLLQPLARLIARASARTQVWVVTHSEILAKALSEESDVRVREVIKQDGRTWINGLSITGNFTT